MAVVGNPTNPTGVLHDPARLLAWDVPHLVVDEAFMDVAGEEHSLAARVVDNPQLIVLRSFNQDVGHWQVFGVGMCWQSRKCWRNCLRGVRIGHWEMCSCAPSRR